jgi:hypothetical protein
VAKTRTLDAKTRAGRVLRRLGATQPLLDEYELAVLHEVMSHGSISGNASAYVLDRIDELEK